MLSLAYKPILLNVVVLSLVAPYFAVLYFNFLAPEQKTNISIFKN
jgi:hypothetical protein